MKPQLKKTGYYNVNLMRPDKRITTERVHRLVALYFCKKEKGCNVVNHLDSNKQNNHYSNLEWTTVSGNTKHCYRNNPAFRQQVRENSRKGASKRIMILKVTNDEGKTVGIFKGIKEAARVLGINEKTIRNIKDGKFATNRFHISIETVAQGGDAR